MGVVARHILLLCSAGSALVTALNICFGLPLFSTLFGFLTLWYGVGYLLFDGGNDEVD